MTAEKIADILGEILAVGGVALIVFIWAVWRRQRGAEDAPEAADDPPPAVDEEELTRQAEEYDPPDGSTQR